MLYDPNALIVPTDTIDVEYKNSFTVLTFKLILLRKKFPMCRIFTLADIRPMEYGFPAVVVFGLGKDFLFKSILGRCDEKARILPQNRFHPIICRAARCTAAT